MKTIKESFRIEKDSLGDVKVPFAAYYGAETQRAIENFKISGDKPDWDYTCFVIMIKRCAARVNMEAGWQNPEKSKAIQQACEDVSNPDWQDQFVVDPFQAGAGTSHHMNINEVIANRATEILGGKKGEYIVNSHNDVNMGQSTNDVIPTAIRLGCMKKNIALIVALNECIATLNNLKNNYQAVKKSGRTHLQDAAPITIGAEFGAYARIFERDMEWLECACRRLGRLGIGGSAVGSGVNTPPDYQNKMVTYLKEYSQLDLQPADDLYETMQSMADFVNYSSALRTIAVSVTKICNDLRLLSSGPETGLNEVNLPAVQPGSSIMPGKVNPVIPEMVNMVMYHVMGLDHSIMLAGQAGQLELNVMMPLIARNLFEMQRLITNSLHTLNSKCLVGIVINDEKITQWLEANPIWITGLTRLIGYQAAAQIVKTAALQKVSVANLIEQKITNQELQNIQTGKQLTLSDYTDWLKEN